MKIHPPVFAVNDDKKKTERKKRESITQSQKGYISAIWGADHLGPIFTKIGKVKGAHDAIILFNFGFNTFGGFRSTRDQNLHPLHPLVEFAGHRYNSATVPLPRSV